MKQYLDLCKKVIENGSWIYNNRTGIRCLTIINADFTYDLRQNRLPILTTKRMAWQSAVGEILGYLRGYDSAAQFRELGCNTWNANANDNKAWLQNPFRRGVDDMGRAYGPQARDWRTPEGGSVDQLYNVYTDLRKGIDNRSEIVTFMNPGERDRACLNSCMHTHTFSILDGYLYLTSYQRSCDLALGVPFNMLQVGFLLMVMAAVTGLKPGLAFHKMVNVHIYENQLDYLKMQIKREPKEKPRMILPPWLISMHALEKVVPTDFTLDNYQHHPAIKIPFSV